MEYAVTGHRPAKLVTQEYRNNKSGRTITAYDDFVYHGLVKFAGLVLVKLPDHPTMIYTGMALGWDQAVAEACILLSIPFTACIPFVGQESQWPAHAIGRYSALLSRAADKVVVSDGGYHPWKMKRRDIYMVDRATSILALWNGSKGGTGFTAGYAIDMEKQLLNVWNEWVQFRDQELFKNCTVVSRISF